MAGAYYEKIARINLTTGEIKVEPLDLELAHKFIGGRGLGTKILYDEGVATVDPLSPGNKLIYITGPMTGAAAPSTGRYMVVTKSPLTGMIACSNSGGIWGAKLKYAGWDAIIVEGEATEWTYISIVDDKIELLDAREYLGVMSEAIDEKLKEKHGADASVLNIGPAGEKKVLLAAILNDKGRAAGRSGVGAVMGSKKLKAIVVRATRKNLDHIADVAGLKVATKNAMDVLKANPVTGAGLRQLGTAVLVNIVNNIGAFPTKNWQEHTDKYPSQSEADMAFASMLAFWCGCDFEQMNRIFEASGLYREKWDRAQSGSTYGAITLENAIKRCTETYCPTTSAADEFAVLDADEKDYVNPATDEDAEEAAKRKNQIDTILSSEITIDAALSPQLLSLATWAYLHDMTRYVKLKNQIPKAVGVRIFEREVQKVVKSSSTKTPVQLLTLSGVQTHGMLVPENWVVNDSGIRHMEMVLGELKPVLFSAEPLFVSAKLVNVDDTTEKLEITFRRNSKYKTLIAPRADKKIDCFLWSIR